MRLDKYLSDAGIGTRSDVKKLIYHGRVEVNGNIEKNPGLHVDENTAIVKVKGKEVAFASFEYFLLNKPQGVISASRQDLRDKDTLCVVDLIKDKIRGDLFPVGRLDKDTEGLLLITNDVVLAHNLLSPKHHVDKEYYVELDGELKDEFLSALESGVDIGDEDKTLPCKVEKLSDSTCNITIHEGRYHQVKRMFEAFGLTVTYLKRIRMGNLTLGNLSLGEYIKISRDDIETK